MTKWKFKENSALAIFRKVYTDTLHAGAQMWTFQHMFEATTRVNLQSQSFNKKGRPKLGPPETKPYFGLKF